MNLNQQENWMDKIFQNKLSNFEIGHEDHIWEGIAKRLDDPKRRIAAYGSWWTIALSTLIVLMVIGAGSYIIYKWNKQLFIQNQRNKDLPYEETKSNNDLNTAAIAKMTSDDDVLVGKAVLNSKEHHIVNTKQFISSVNRTDSKIEANRNVANTQPVINNNNWNTANRTRHSSEIQSTTAVSPVDNKETSANNLIASTDLSFLETTTPLRQNFDVEKMPLTFSGVNKEMNYLIAPALLDGCNVYKNNNSHFFVDAYYAPELANRYLTTEDPNLISYTKERVNSEQAIMSYSLGLRASYVLSNRIALRGGISYSNNTERFNFVKERQTITIEIKDKDGNLLRTEIKEIVILDKIYNHYKYIDVPLVLGYEKDLKDFILSLNGGIGINLVSQQTGKIYKPDIKTVYDLADNGEANQPIFKKSAGMSLIGSIGLNYKYNERILLLLEPSARYYIHSLSDPANKIDQRYLFLGINVGLRYRVK